MVMPEKLGPHNQKFNSTLLQCLLSSKEQEGILFTTSLSANRHFDQFMIVFIFAQEKRSIHHSFGGIGIFHFVKSFELEFVVFM